MIEAVITVLTLVAIYAVVVRLCATVESVSTQWSEAWRYYTRGRAGVLEAMEEEVRAEAKHDALSEADDLFAMWHESVQWNSEEQADHVRNLWRVAFRSGAGQAQKAAALAELRMLGAPIPKA